MSKLLSRFITVVLVMITIVSADAGVRTAHAAFTPSSVSGLQMWLDASQGVYQDSGMSTGASSDGDRVGGWTDLSGNANNASSTGSNRPTLRLNRINGRPSLQFDAATSTYMAHPYTGELGTVFVVGKRNSVVSQNDTWLGADTSDAVTVGAYYFKAGNTGGTLESYRTVSGDTSSSGWSAQAPDGALYNTWYVQAGTLSTTSKVMTLWKNDQQIGKGRTSQTVRPIKSGTTVIGSSYYNHSLSGSYLTGEIAEIIVYDHPLTETEIRQVDDYLSTKYGITYLRQQQPPTTRPAYVYPSFNGSSEKLRIFYSSDGTSFQEAYTTINDYSYMLAVRDPDMFYAGGYYWIAYTNTTFGSSTTSFSLARSSTWNGPFQWITNVDASSISSVNRVWSPIHFIDPADGTLHILFSATTGGDNGSFKQYRVEPTSADLTTWSTPVELGGVATAYPNTIAGFIQKKGSTYYLWIKDESATAGGGKYNVIMTSTSPFSGYATYKTGNWAGWGQDKFEGAYPVQVSGSTWRVYMDNYNNGTGGEYYSESTDDWSTWSTAAPLTITPSGYGQSRNGLLLYSSGSLSASPSAISPGTANQTISLTGVGTSWISGTPQTPTFSISGLSGARIVSQSVADATHATLTIVPGTAAGTITITDPSSTATASLTVINPATAASYTGTAGGSISPAQLALLLAPSAQTTAYLTSLGMTGCPTGSSCASPSGSTAPTATPSFARDLHFGMSGSDVRTLQQFLNGKGFTVAPSGPGSLGRETTVFGNATRGAVIRFQKYYGIVPAAGYVGPKTRAQIGSLTPRMAI